MPNKPNHDFLKSWGVLIATILIQVGMYIAKDARLQEDIKNLMSEVRALNDFKSSYTIKIDAILEKVRAIK